MNPTYEQIERGAEAMAKVVSGAPWWAIDQGERNHWLRLAEACLRAALPSEERGSGA